MAQVTIIIDKKVVSKAAAQAILDLLKTKLADKVTDGTITIKSIYKEDLQ